MQRLHNDIHWKFVHGSMMGRDERENLEGEAWHRNVAK